MANISTSLLINAVAKSVACKLPHGTENFSELLEAFGQAVDLNQFTAEQLAAIIDFADFQRQQGFREAVIGYEERGHSAEELLGGYDSTEDRCDRLDLAEQNNEGDDEAEYDDEDSADDTDGHEEYDEDDIEL